MPPAQKAAISLGVMYIPVELYVATHQNDISFNQLSKQTGARIRYKKVDELTGKEVESDEIIRGFQYDKDEYVEISQAEIDAITTNKDRSLHIELFTDLHSIPPVYFDKSFYVASQEGGEKAYELICSAMMKSNKVAIGRTVLGTKEKLFVLIPTGNGMVLTTLFYYDEVKDVPKESSGPEPSKAEMEMAQQLIDAWSRKFEPEKYTDEYRDRLRAMIEAKIQGKALPKPKKDEAAPSIKNLMDALKASMPQSPKSKKPLKVE